MNISSQYIDKNGKMRAITYDETLSLILPPNPPIDGIQQQSKLINTSLSIALQYIEKNNHKIKYQDGNEETGIHGLWLEGDIYIPLEPQSDIINYLPFAPISMYNPIKVLDEDSEIQQMRGTKRIANLLKQYVLYAYANYPQTFSLQSIEVIPNYKYREEDITEKFNLNNSILSNGIIRVSSQDIKIRLYGYLKLMLLNDTPGVMAMKDQRSPKDMFQSLYDFRPHEDQLIFFDIQNIERWKQEENRRQSQNTIFPYLLPEYREPYFYRNNRIHDGKIILVQNVRDLNTGLIVAEKWIKDRVNLGYRAKGQITKISYRIYSENGEYVSHNNNTKEVGELVEYHDGSYGVLLNIS
jgi:hypothetical protein